MNNEKFCLTAEVLWRMSWHWIGNHCAMIPAGRKKPVSATPKEMDWAQMACHRCLVYLGDLGKNRKIKFRFKLTDSHSDINNSMSRFYWQKPYIPYMTSIQGLENVHFTLVWKCCSHVKVYVLCSPLSERARRRWCWAAGREILPSGPLCHASRWWVTVMYMEFNRTLDVPPAHASLYPSVCRNAL